MREREGRLFVGLFWGVLFCIPLWISLWGWIRLVAGLISG
jgi:cytoskeletal protein RodZ